jgi:hypothetical protein
LSHSSPTSLFCARGFHGRRNESPFSRNAVMPLAAQTSHCCAPAGEQLHRTRASPAPYRLGWSAPSVPAPRARFPLFGHLPSIRARPSRSLTTAHSWPVAGRMVMPAGKLHSSCWIDQRGRKPPLRTSDEGRQRVKHPFQQRKPGVRTGRHSNNASLQINKDKCSA